jgi:hypothetical protein
VMDRQRSIWPICTRWPAPLLPLRHFIKPCGAGVSSRNYTAVKDLRLKNTPCATFLREGGPLAHPTLLGVVLPIAR